jgi:hypothetical protein
MQELFFEAFNTVSGNIDLFYSTWNSFSSEWRMRQALPATINVPGYDERHPFINRDHSHLYYDTDRPGGPGNFDIWVSEYIHGSWITPQPLPEPVNSTGYEAAPYIAYYPGGQQLYYETTRSGTNELFVSEWDPIGEMWESPKRMCLDFISSLHPSINTVGNELLYHTDIGLGDYDIWISECLPTPTPTGTWVSPTPTITPTPKIPVDDMSLLPFLLMALVLSITVLRVLFALLTHT